MTMPHLMNCDHSDEGWCLDCVKKLHDEMESYRTKWESVQYGGLLARIIGLEAELARIREPVAMPNSPMPNGYCQVCGIDLNRNTHYVCGRSDCPSSVRVVS